MSRPAVPPAGAGDGSDARLASSAPTQPSAREAPPAPHDLGSLGLPTPPQEGPAFAEPWQADVFAMTVHLAERHVFAWPRFAQALGAQLRDEPDYYRAWSAALLDLLAAEGIVSPDEVREMEGRWHAAAAATPHGQAITLPGMSSQE